MHIRHFGTHSWGSELFEKQKDILFQIKLLFSSSPCLSSLGKAIQYPSIFGFIVRTWPQKLGPHIWEAGRC